MRTTPEATDLHAILAVMEERDTDTCVMEVSSHALSQHRVDGVVYDLALFTNLSQDHLDFHADMEDYFSAKAQLFTPLRSQRALVCVDDVWGRRLAEQSGRPGDHAHDRCPASRPTGSSPSTRDDPSRFTLRGRDLELDLRSALPGDFNVANTAMAAVALLLLGEETDAVSRAILTDPHVPGPHGEGRPAADEEDLLAVVDYAHTPGRRRGRPRGPAPHAPGAGSSSCSAPGETATGASATAWAAPPRAWPTSSSSPTTTRAARTRPPSAPPSSRARGRSTRAPSSSRSTAGARAIREGVRLAREGGPGSVVAVVGKGHETGQEVAGVVHPFDDRDVLAGRARRRR